MNEDIADGERGWFLLLIGEVEFEGTLDHVVRD